MYGNYKYKLFLGHLCELKVKNWHVSLRTEGPHLENMTPFPSTSRFNSCPGAESARLQLCDYIFSAYQVMALEGNLSGAVSLKTSFIETCGTIDHLQ